MWLDRHIHLYYIDNYNLIQEFHKDDGQPLIPGPLCGKVKVSPDSDLSVIRALSPETDYCSDRRLYYIDPDGNIQEHMWNSTGSIQERLFSGEWTKGDSFEEGITPRKGSRLQFINLAFLETMAPRPRAFIQTEDEDLRSLKFDTLSWRFSTLRQKLPFSDNAAVFAACLGSEGAVVPAIFIFWQETDGKIYCRSRRIMSVSWSLRPTWGGKKAVSEEDEGNINVMASVCGSHTRGQYKDNLHLFVSGKDTSVFKHYKRLKESWVAQIVKLA
ncbi:hypothetical protein H072_887 [Dactylellina haptotyla CBS 200.50]|uniref:Fucose-specific lectin n=1 Tax=Dactylellina haptotyla (strain CBS 200.50) TaxID=1284197 RepID=S8AQG8_DACHA|nr:hypothetical protein H072_887 [Dactylellina haptotyla CBS 200.50]